MLVPERVRVAAGASPSAAAATAIQPGVPLNLNTATIEQLDGYDGIGPATAQSILDYREENGGFSSVRRATAKYFPGSAKSGSPRCASEGAGVRCGPPPRWQR